MLRTSIRPTLIGRAVLLVTGLVLANAACWVAAGICLSGADGLLGIAMLAWVSRQKRSVRSAGAGGRESWWMGGRRRGRRGAPPSRHRPLLVVPLPLFDLAAFYAPAHTQTLGLRHGLDADHISAIDNATRQMVSLGRLPMTCGLFFSLGHSTIVIAVNIAIAVR